jgi:hypothetical protein
METRGMREHDAAPKAAAPAPPSARSATPPTQLPQAIGNRAMGRMLARMETTEAVDALAESLASGVMGAEHRVIDTMTAFSSDTAGFDKVSEEYEKKTKTPLEPGLHQVPGAPELIPGGWYPGIGKS